MSQKVVKIILITLAIITVTGLILSFKDNFLVGVLGKCPKDKSLPFENLMNSRTLKNFSLENDKNVEITLIISTSSPDHALGLSNIPCIPPQNGMIFEFAQPDYYGFWMKDTLVNLDIAWLDESYNVVFLLSDVAISTYPNILRPEPPYKSATYVIEMASGEMKRLGIKVGAKLTPLAPQN